MLYHATHLKNLESIRANGILKSYSTGRSEMVWLHNRSMWSYAAHHVAERHGWEPQDVVIIEVSVHHISPKATRWYGIFNYADDIAPEQLGRAFQISTVPIERAAPANPRTSAA